MYSFTSRLEKQAYEELKRGLFMQDDTTRLFSECALGEGIHFRSIQDRRFKTQRISIHMMVPLKKETAAANAMLPYLLTRTNRAYPDYTLLGRRMQGLYGASLSGDVQKLGDVQVLSISATGISDRYALHGEKISQELTELLCSSLFEPHLDQDGLFPQDGFAQEKRQTLEMIDSELNDKRIYAKRRGLELLLDGEPAALSRYGTREAVESLTREEVASVWQELLHHARFEIMVMGDCFPELVVDTLRGRFPVGRELSDCTTIAKPSSGQVRERTDCMDVVQCKLIMGFRTGISAQQWQELPALKLMCAVLGGTPHSKLFANVREKMSLCYYCSSRYDSNKGILLIESGVEESNLEKAREAILQQLEEIRSGNVTEEEITSAKLSACNGLRTVEDYLGGMESWYLSQTFHPRTLTPEESAQEMQQVTAEQIQKAAEHCVLDAVDVMKGGNEA